jgi:plastocyanin
MRRTAVALACAAAGLAAPAAARAEELTIRMPGKFFEPARSTAVAGDLVTFRNNDLVTHDVRVAGGLFDSGPMPRFTTWSQAFAQPGAYPFVCTLHAFMSGNLDVVAATLAAEPDGVLAGEPLTLSGRTTAGTAQLAVERSTAAGGWEAVGAAVTPAPDGMFSAQTPAVEGASYRVSTPAGQSPAVTPRVTARVDVHISVRHTRRHAIVEAHAMPAPAGFVATLELYSRWHFRWRAGAANFALAGDGHARFRVPAARRTFARVALSRSRRGPALVYSGVVKLPTGRAARDPDLIAPPGGGHDGGHPGH